MTCEGKSEIRESCLNHFNCMVCLQAMMTDRSRRLRAILSCATRVAPSSGKESLKVWAPSFHNTRKLVT